VRNSSLVERRSNPAMCRGTDDPPGLKPATEAADCEIRLAMVGERPRQPRSQLGRAGGAAGSANVGMSSARDMECRRKNKVKYPPLEKIKQTHLTQKSKENTIKYKQNE